MFGRRSARVKVMHVVYAHGVNTGATLNDLATQLDLSFTTSTRSFYYFLNLLGAVPSYALRKEELAVSSLSREDPRIPETRLLSSSGLEELIKSEFLHDAIRQHGAAKVDDELLRHLFDELSGNDKIQDWLSQDTFSKEDDDQLLKVLVYEVLLADDTLQSFMEDLDAWWTEESGGIASSVLELARQRQPETTLARLKEKLKDSQEFSSALLKATLKNEEEYTELIRPIVTNWEVERIAALDMILMRMALTEMLAFQHIPVKVTINEYLDIAKGYSTPKSQEFINGILDKLLHKLQAEGRVQKTGRGLLDK